MSLKNLTSEDHVRFYTEFASIVERRMNDADQEMFMSPLDKQVMEELVEVNLESLHIIMQSVAEVHSDAMRLLQVAALLRGGPEDLEKAVMTVLRSVWFDGFAYHAYVRKQVSG